MSHMPVRKNSKLPMLRPVFAILISLGIFVSLSPGSPNKRPQESGVFSKCWDYKTASTGTGITADASNVYFLDDENKLNAVDLTLGIKVWSTELGGEVVSNLLVVNDSIFVVTNLQPDAGNSSGKSIFRALSRHTGITERHSELQSSTVISLGSLHGNVIAVGIDGSVSAFTRSDGSLVWKIGLGSDVTSQPDFSDSGVELGTRKNEVLKISGNGIINVAWKSEYLPTAVGIVSGGRHLIGDDRGNLSLVSASGNRLWRFRNGAQISSASQHGSDYLATSFDNFVYKLSRNGNVKWKRRLSGRVSDKPISFGSTAVISIVGTGSVYVLDLGNGKILNRIETGDEASLRVAAASDSRGFVIAGPRGLSFFSGKCASK